MKQGKDMNLCHQSKITSILFCSVFRRKYRSFFNKFK